jgi:hypothetical protein
VGSQSDHRNGRIVGMESRDLEPVESNELPLTSRESQPPLVVDLPDGQKLVVGDLDPGTVIEVATWRGTGRPDSRTNRFMLGVSTNEAEGLPSKRSVPKPAELIENQNQESNFINQAVTQSNSSREQFISNQITTGVIYANVNPDSRGKQLTTTKEITKKSLLKKIAFWVSSVLVVAGAVFILLGPVGLKFAHPVGGASTALGQADSSIVVVKAQDKYVVGDSVISDLPQNQPSPVVAVIAAVSDRALLLSTGTGYMQIRPEQLHGKVVGVLPFIGQIANLIS